MTAWRDPKVQPHVRAVAAEIRDRFGMTNIGGWGLRDNVSDHPRGLALDVMTFKGQPVADWAVANAEALNITYVIWDRKIWSVARANEGWRNYVGRSPHIDHVHISFSATPKSSTSNVGWKDKLGDGLKAGANVLVPGTNLLPDNPLDTLKDFGKVAAWLIDPRNWYRVFLFLGGAALIWVALARLAKDVASPLAMAALTKGKIK